MNDIRSKSLFSPPKTPVIADPTPLPDQDQETSARRRGVAKAAKSSSFSNTILSAGGRETLGG